MRSCTCCCVHLPVSAILNKLLDRDNVQLARPVVKFNQLIIKHWLYIYVDLLMSMNGHLDDNAQPQKNQDRFFCIDSIQH